MTRTSLKICKFRFTSKCQKKLVPGLIAAENGLTATELKYAELFLCRQAQYENLNAEMKIHYYKYIAVWMQLAGYRWTISSYYPVVCGSCTRKK